MDKRVSPFPYLSGAARRVSKAPSTRPANMPRKRSNIAARVGRLAYASAKRLRLVPYAERVLALREAAFRLTYLRTHLVGARSSFLAKLEVTYCLFCRHMKSTLPRRHIHPAGSKLVYVTY